MNAHEFNGLEKFFNPVETEEEVASSSRFSSPGNSKSSSRLSLTTINENLPLQTDDSAPSLSGCTSDHPLCDAPHQIIEEPVNPTSDQQLPLPSTEPEEQESEDLKSPQTDSPPYPSTDESTSASTLSTPASPPRPPLPPKPRLKLQNRENRLSESTVSRNG